MALVYKDRVKSTSTTTGTGTYTLGSASTGFQGFSAVGNGGKCCYCATDGTDWEVGVGTYTTAGTVLERTTILKSSNSDAAVNWSAGTKTIFLTMPADRDIVGTANQITVTESDTTADLTLSLDGTLAAIAALTVAADKLIYATGADAFATTDFSSFARTILDDANAAAVRTTIGAGTGSGDLLAANNLSDVATAATARTNLGVGTGDSPQFAAINLGHASDTSITRVSAGLIAVEGVNVVTTSETQTLTNKRYTPRIGTEASSATSTPTSDTVDQWNVTALAEADAFAAPTGTPTNGQHLIIRIKDNGTARALSWNAIYRAGTDVVLPSTTVISKTVYLGFIYNSADSKWDLLVVTGNI